MASRRIILLLASAVAVFVVSTSAAPATPLPGPDHATPSRAGDVDPRSLLRLEDMSKETAEAIWQTLGYPLESLALDFRVADPSQALGLSSSAAALRTRAAGTLGRGARRRGDMGAGRGPRTR